MYVRPNTGGAHSVTNDASGDDGPATAKLVGIFAVAAYATYRVIT